MKTRRRFITLVSSLLIYQLLLIGCNPSAPILPTETERIPISTYTQSPQPSPTPSIPPPTHTPIDSDIEFVERTPLTNSGFSFIPLINLHSDIHTYHVTMANMDQTFLLTLAAKPREVSLIVYDEMSEFLSSMRNDIPDLENQPPVDVQINNQPGLTSNISGSLSGGPFTGRVTVVTPATGPAFYAIAISMDPPLGNGWEEEGLRFYSIILETVIFFEPSEITDECSVSSDQTYGFQQNNPIRIGGEAFGGPARARAYLDNLSGPQDQVIEYERIGSIPFEDTILDTYTLNYQGISSPLTIYIDNYSFEKLAAPIGLKCLGPFPIMP